MGVDEKIEVWFNNEKESGYYWHFEKYPCRRPTSKGWFLVGVYDYDDGIDLIYLYSLIPFSVRKEMYIKELGNRRGERT